MTVRDRIPPLGPGADGFDHIVATSFRADPDAYYLARKEHPVQVRVTRATSFASADQIGTVTLVTFLPVGAGFREVHIALTPEDVARIARLGTEASRKKSGAAA